jgi:hypothetical protein
MLPWSESMKGTVVNRAEQIETKPNLKQIMKTKFVIQAFIAALLLAGSAGGVFAQDTTPACPFGYPPGTGKTLSTEQRAQHIAALQATVQALQAKQEAGTLSNEEQAWLQQVEQRGGYFRTGIPRGKRGGQEAVQGLRQGPRDGAGPRGDGTGRRLGQGKGPRDGAAVGGGRGYGHGARNGARTAGGQQLRHGPRDGTGPRALMNDCPGARAPQPQE